MMVVRFIMSVMVVPMQMHVRTQIMTVRRNDAATSVRMGQSRPQHEERYQ